MTAAAGIGLAGGIDPWTCTHDEWEQWRAGFTPDQLTPAERAEWQWALGEYQQRLHADSQQRRADLTQRLDERDNAAAHYDQLLAAKQRISGEIDGLQERMLQLSRAINDEPDDYVADQYAHQRDQLRHQLYDLQDRQSELQAQLNTALDRYMAARRAARG